MSNSTGRMSDLEKIRHSSAHILATAISRIWPEVQFAAGPPVKNGFYYDLDLDHKITPNDFQRIEGEMQNIVKENQVFEKQIISREEAFDLCKSGRLGSIKSRNKESVFKFDILKSIPKEEEISIYKNGDFWDLCAGDHVYRTGNCKAFKLLNVSSSFYKGDASNPQLQRIYGTAFKNKTLLNEHLKNLEKAKELDHRKIGKDLELFHIDEEVGQGLILWKPKGAIIRQELQNFISEHLERQNYKQVFTPHIGKLDLYITSGHFPYYSDSQFTPFPDQETLKVLSEENCTCGELSNKLETGQASGFLLKPMNCPHHIKIFQSSYFSYRDLPIKLCEFGTVYRWEQSGELSGMTRVRGFTQDDAHIFCSEEQLENEILECLELVKTVLNQIGMNDYRVRIGLRDSNSDKYVGSSENWNNAENALRKAAQSLNTKFTEEEGEAAFYGPKIDFVVTDVIGREWQLGTIQVDYNLPERFNLQYIGADNSPHRPVMIHRAPFGSMERFVGVLIEHFSGKFPTWLSPEQIRILPISEKFYDYAKFIENELRSHNLRVHLDNSNETIGSKIRLAQLDKIPYMIIVGAKEEENKTISIRKREKGDIGELKLESFIKDINKEIKYRKL